MRRFNFSSVLLLCLLSFVCSQRFDTLLQQRGCLSSPIDGPANVSCIAAAWAGAADSKGNIFFVDSNRIRKFDTKTNNITTMWIQFEGTTDKFQTMNGQMVACSSFACHSTKGVCYAACGTTVQQISPSGVVSHVAGLQGSASDVDGTFENARFNTAGYVVLDEARNVLFVKSSTAVRELNLDTRMVTSHTALASATRFAICPGKDTMMVVSGGKLGSYDITSKTLVTSAVTVPTATLTCYNDTYYGNTASCTSACLIQTIDPVTFARTTYYSISMTSFGKTVDSLSAVNGYLIINIIQDRIVKLNLETKELTVLVGGYNPNPKGDVDNINTLSIKYDSTVIGAFNENLILITDGLFWYKLDATSFQLRVIQAVSSPSTYNSGYLKQINGNTVGLAVDKDDNLYYTGRDNRQLFKLTLTNPDENLYTASVLAGSVINGARVSGKFPGNLYNPTPTNSAGLALFDDIIRITLGIDALSIYNLTSGELTVPATTASTADSSVIDGPLLTSTYGILTSPVKMTTRTSVHLERGTNNMYFRKTDYDAMTVTTQRLTNTKPYIGLYSDWTNFVSATAALGWLNDHFYAYFSSTTQKLFMIQYNFTKEVYTTCGQPVCVQDSAFYEDTLYDARTMLNIDNTLYVLEQTSIRKMVIERPGPPTVAILAVNATSVSLSFSLHPSKWGGTFLKGYRIEYSKELSKTEPTIITLEDLGVWTKTTTISDLDSNESYVLDVYAVTVAYDSAPTTIIVDTD